MEDEINKKQPKKSTMKTPSTIKKISTLSIISLFFIATPSYSWDGYDHDHATSIEIGKGNLVREGLTIEFYDWSDDKYHVAKILSQESASSGTELIIKDLENGEIRTFLMEN